MEKLPKEGRIMMTQAAVGVRVKQVKMKSLQHQTTAEEMDGKIPGLEVVVITPPFLLHLTLSNHLLPHLKATCL